MKEPNRTLRIRQRNKPLSRLHGYGAFASRNCELLEPRLQLSANTCLRTTADLTQESFDLPELFASNSAAVSASAVRALDAGSTLGTATDLGQLGAARSLLGSVGGLDPSDVLRFSLAGQSKVNLGLAGLSSDIDMALYNSSGQRIALSDRAGSAAESISQTLSAGTYYLSVFPYRRASSSYVLTVGATSTLPVTPTTPIAPTTPTVPTVPTVPTAPTTPTTPTTSPIAAFPDVAYFGGSNEWNLNSINAPEAWAQGYKGDGVVVAVIDTGVDVNHPDLMSRMWVNAGEISGNGIDDDHNGFVDDVSGWDFVGNDNNPDDANGHGTHVAGTIAADDNGFGATGVAPDATIMPVRVLDGNGSGSDAGVAAGIRYAAQNGADIINLSLGGGFSSAIQSAIQFAQQRDVLVVVAAGNESASSPSYPARFSAALSNVLSVGAYSSSNTIASFSNDVGASAAVQVDAPGVSVYSTYSNGRFGILSGTSMATPHVAGLAALALSANPNLTAAQLRAVIVNGANRVINGSDARGGINAALTVALAATGQTSSSVTTQSQPASQSVTFGGFAIRFTSTSDTPTVFQSASERTTSSPTVAQNLPQVVASTRSESLERARDQAIAALCATNSLVEDSLSDDADLTALGAELHSDRFDGQLA